MNEPIRIAPATAHDHEWCAQLMVSSEPWITLRRDLPGCRDVLARPGTGLFVARDGNSDTPAAFILLASYGFAGSPYIASIAVAPNARSRGLGSRLLEFAEQHYAERRHLFLLVSSFNDRAQQFYRKHGYERVGELRDYIVPGHSELIFYKSLA